MAMPWGMALWMANMVWVALIGWVSSCLTVADELASSLRTGDIGPFHIISTEEETILQNLELSILCNCAMNVCKV
ncbi:hypothetical protein NC653_035995 [Populus alba x Populus x berolinensis]|uniref:Uncharacterized protein n=1 Tax=Populus alba x Populus x berolinensis TaxID=444605 RepID=A0AAD6LJ14_9ROSI|nr:hypothetical protein NC653_035995 [Populus alba x Populus x berolinensis]